MLRIALIVLLALVAAEARAYPAVNSYCSTNAVAGTQCGFASAVAACQAITSCQALTHGLGSQYCSTYSAAFTETSGNNCRFITTPDSLNFTGGTYSGPTLGCPNGGTFNSGTSQCECASGYTDTGTACELNSCPAAGTDAGVRNVTTGWALSPNPGANDVVSQVPAGEVWGGTHCVSDGAAMCNATIDPGAASVIDCWQSQNPTDQGLYRISCDFKMSWAGGAACSAGGPSNPVAGGPSCPTGNVGTVNGTPVCLGTMPATGVDFGDSPTSGNPRAGTSPVTESNVGREPAAGSGGGPDARGGPGVTVGPGGTIGTGNNRSGTSGGTGSGEIKVEVETCGLPGTPPCKIDETGTPTTSNATTTATENVQGNVDELGTKLEGIVSGAQKPSNIGWGVSSITFPTNCSPFSIGTARWGFFTIDLCQYQDVIHDLMSLVWVSFTLFLSVGMVFRAVSGG